MCCMTFLFLILIISGICYANKEEEEGVIYANRCEVCKILATELELRLDETGKTNDVIEIGYSVDDVKPKKRTKYRKSELRLVESLEGLCERVLQYNIHKERKDSSRFDKGMSQTFQTLHGLVNKGVKVELGIPYELWDKPSAEITNMKTQCETLLEENEHEIEDWYFNHQGEIPLKTYLCSERALRGESDSCLEEPFPSLTTDKSSSQKSYKKKKKKKGEDGQKKPRKKKTKEKESEELDSEEEQDDREEKDEL